MFNKDSGECSRRFGGMIKKTLGNVYKVIKDSGECSRRFQRMLSKIPVNVIEVPGNVEEDLRECKFQLFS